jgi:hypothetical protein
MQTAQIATDIHGAGLYHKRAREALPLLVRQAEADQPIHYGSLAVELGMPNARNLNYPLGSIGTTLQQLSALWGETIPPLQCVVVNKNTGLPGEGIGWFIVKAEDFGRLPLNRRRDIVRAELTKVFAYPRWREVLRALELPPPAAPVSPDLLARATGLGGGEGDQHRALKDWVARHPEVLGLARTAAGVTERPLPSGDSLDVSFERADEWVAAEVKSRISSEADMLRGLFQCIKYRAVMEAVQVAAGRPRAARAVLVLETVLPPSLHAVRNALAVEVMEKVSPAASRTAHG